MSNTIQISRENAVKAYNGADIKGKALLSDLLGEEVFQKITDRVKSFEDACEILNIGPSFNPSSLGKDEIAYIKLKTIAKALNEVWTPDWNNIDEYKYYPFFRFECGRFVYNDYFCDGGCSYLGSRLCFRTKELAEYAGKQFEDLYNDFFNV